jgi:hypothetical protein
LAGKSKAGGSPTRAIEQALAASLGAREAFLERLQLGLDAVQLLDLLRRRLAFRLPLRAQILDRLLHRTDRFVRGQQLVEELGCPLARQRRAK